MMLDFQRADSKPMTNRQIKEMARSTGESISKIRKFARKAAEAPVWLNDKYQVSVTDHETPGGFPDLIWLNIKRLDRQPIHDWRELQEIKNKLVGPEHEAVELYPAESRVVDAANQFHLWVLKKPGLKWPFGMNDRLVVDGTGERGPDGSTQRPLPPIEKTAEKD